MLDFLFGTKSNGEISLPQAVQALVKKASNPVEPKFDPNDIQSLLKFTDTIENSGEVMAAISNMFDESSDNPIIIFKCLKLIIICLNKSHQHFLPAAQAFAPEIQTIQLLAFPKLNITVSKSPTVVVNIHRTVNYIYNHILYGKPLPDLSKFGITKEQIDPPSRPNPQTQHITNSSKNSNIRQAPDPHNRPIIMNPNQQSQNSQYGNPKKSTFLDFDDEPLSSSKGFSDSLFSFNDKPQVQPKTSTASQNTNSKVDMLPTKDRPRVPAAFGQQFIGNQDEQPELLDFGGFSTSANESLSNDESKPISSSISKPNNDTISKGKDTTYQISNKGTSNVDDDNDLFDPFAQLSTVQEPEKSTIKKDTKPNREEIILPSMRKKNLVKQTDFNPFDDENATKFFANAFSEPSTGEEKQKLPETENKINTIDSFSFSESLPKENTSQTTFDKIEKKSLKSEPDFTFFDSTSNDENSHLFNPFENSNETSNQQQNSNTEPFVPFSEQKETNKSNDKDDVFSLLFTNINDSLEQSKNEQTKDDLVDFM